MLSAYILQLGQSCMYTPYSKMATILLFFYIYVNWPSMPRSHLQNSKEFLGRILASRANLHEYKRMIKS